ncbi:hypothetical protein SNS2_2702 [Streptomyces netropsis]|nr:hypothetical protein SNS2_2702 [Streptomyces netropsis]
MDHPAEYIPGPSEGDWKGLGKWMKYTDDNISKVKAELVYVAHSVNAIKPEANFLVLEAIVAGFGVKLVKWEWTLLDLNEKSEERQGRTTKQLKERLDDHVTRIQDVKKSVGRAFTRIADLRRDIRLRIAATNQRIDDVNRRLAQERRAARSRQGQVAAVPAQRNVSPGPGGEAARIRDLESRVQSLIRALG